MSERRSQDGTFNYVQPSLIRSAIEKVHTNSMLKKIDESSKKATLNTIMASSLGALMATAVLNPMLILKVNLQRGRLAKADIQSAKSIGKTAAEIYSQKGLIGFWAGMPMGLLQTVPSTVTYMLMYEKLKMRLLSVCGEKSFVAPIIPGVAAMISRCVTASLISPIELIRTLQASGVGGGSMFIAKSLYKQKGISGFYLGLRATLWRDVPYSFVYWQSYQMMRDQVNPTGVEYNNLWSMGSVFVTGSIASILSACISHPFDVLKTNQQVNIRNLSLTAAAVNTTQTVATVSTAAAMPIECESNVCGTVHELYKRGGMKACFRGLSMRLAMVIPGGAIMITVYEIVKKISEN